jgi:hypothetical protein
LATRNLYSQLVGRKPNATRFDSGRGHCRNPAAILWQEKQMPRYVIVIRDRREGVPPVSYYLSRNGFRCYTAANVYVAHSLAEATEQRDHFAKLMTGFSLTVERLKPKISLSKALLSAEEVVS